MRPLSRLQTLIASATALLCLAVAAPPAWAGQWTGYVATNDPNQLVPFKTGDNVAGTPIALPGSPRDLAISPDGETLYALVGGPDRMIPIDRATGAAGAPLLFDAPVSRLAIASDGLTAYVAATNEGLVYRVDLVTGAVADPIAVGHQVWGIAIHPDGRSAYVTTGSVGGVSRIELGNGLVTRVGDTNAAMKDIAFRPDGLFGYAISSGFNSVFPVAAAAAGGPVLAPDFSAGFQPSEIAITPDGRKAFVVNFSWNQVRVLDLETDSVGSAIAVGDYPWDVAIAPDGRTAYVTNMSSQDLTPIDVATETAGEPIPIGPGATPRWIAITPNQPPTARLSAGPARPDAPVRLDASASVDRDGAIAQYRWDFGDGQSAVTGQPVVEHTYPKGNFEVTVTLTDDVGCSTETVFTGQTASCNGSLGIAQAKLSLAVDDPPPAANDRDPVPGQPAAPRPEAAPARLGPLKAAPRRRAVAPGGSVRFTLRIRNRGGSPTGRLRICASTPRRVIAPVRCKTVRSLAAGRAIKRRFKLRVRRAARPGKRVKVRFKVRGRGLKSRASRVAIRIR